jgi:FkbM family methyltransferase
MARPQVYTGLARTPLTCARPVDFLRRYLTGAGQYPVQIGLRTPIGPLEVTAFLPEDVLTINEVFLWRDYGSTRQSKVVVDFGSNIGISALYFLSRNRRCRVYCHEPLPQNVARFRHNLRGFRDRCTLAEVAVAEADGEATFGYEPTGRYGGIGMPSRRQRVVPTWDSNRVLHEVLERHGEIDLLKIDIERLEQELTRRIPVKMAARIRRLVVDLRLTENPLPDTHVMRYRWPVTTLVRKSA